TRLSDLSGSLSANLSFDSYLTVYPLPSGEYFAVARTWPDPGAPRAGCVLTHTLLVPEAEWRRLDAPWLLDRLLVRPKVEALDKYKTFAALPKWAERPSPPLPI